MASDSNKDINLRIRAKDYSKKPFKELNQSLADLSAAQKKQQEAAKKGEVSTSELEKSYGDLEKAVRAALRQVADITSYEAQQQAIKATESALSGARTKLNEFSAALAEQAKPTADQAAKMAVLSEAVRKNAAELTAAREAQAKFAASAGSDMTTAQIAAMNKLSAATTSAEKSLAKAEKAQSSYVKTVEKENKATTDQRQELRALEKRHSALQTAYEKSLVKSDKMAAGLALIGVDAANTASAIETFRQSVNTANASLAAQEKAIESNALHLEEMAARSKAAAEAEKAAAQARAAAEVEAAAKEAAAAKERAAAQAAAAKAAQDAAKAQEKAAQDAAQAAEVAAALDAQRKALQSVAADALSAAKGWRTAAVGAGALSEAVIPLEDQVRNLSKPANAATTSLSALEKTTEGLATGINKIKGPVKDLADRYSALRDVTAKLTETSKLIDVFRKQTAAVTAARTAYVNARTEVASLSAALNTAAGATSDNEHKLAAAEARLASSATAFRTLADSARNTQAQLRQAGVSTANLAAEETRVISTSNALGSAYATLAAKVKEYGKAQTGAGDGSRQSLSLMQRLRGEVLSLAATYTGLYGAIKVAGDVIDAVKIKQQAMAAISVAVGKDTKAQAAEWDFLTKSVNKYGFSLPDAAKQYGKFAAAAAKGGQSMSTVHYLYDQVLSIGRAYNLSSDEMGRAMLALEQMIGKAQIYAQDFKGQFAEVIPGAVEIAAEKLHMTVPQFNKAMESGVLDMSALVQIMRGLGEESKGAAEQASKGIIAAEGRLSTAKFSFMQQVADSGFIDSYTNLITRLTTLMKSDDGVKLANAMGKAFSSVADVADYAATHIDQLTGVLKVIGFVYATKMAVSFAGTIKNGVGFLVSYHGWLGKAASALSSLSTVIGTTSVAARLCGGSLMFMSKAIPFVGWAIAIGAFLVEVYQASETFRNIVDGVVQMAVASFEYLVNIAKGQYKSFAEVSNQVRKDFEKNKRSMMDQQAPEASAGSAGATIASAASNAISDPGETYDPQKGAKMAFDKWVEKESKETAEAQLAADKAAAKKNLSERLKLVETEYAPRLKEAHARAAEDGGKAEAAVQKIINDRKKIEQEKYNTEMSNSSVNSAKTRAEKIKEIEASIKASRDKLATRDDKLNPTESFDTREAAQIESAKNAYAGLEAQVRKLGGAEAERFTAAINDLKQQEAGLTAQKAQLAEIARLQQQLSALMSARDAQVEAIKAKHDAGLTSEVDYTNQVNAAYNNTKPAIDSAIAEIQKFAAAHQAAFSSPEEYQKLTANLDTYKTKLDQTGKETNTYMTQALTGVSQSVGTGFDSIVSSLTQIKQGTADWGDLMSNLGSTMASFFADLLKQIAMAIIQAAILKALMAAFGGGAAAGATGATGAASGATATAGVNHIGGMAGSPGQGARSVPASVFAGATKYHTGGMVGFAADEVPIVAKEGEEVLTRKDPRNRLNGGLDGDSGSQSTRIIAVDDHRTAVAEALKTPEGEKAMIVNMRQNLPTIKKMLRS